MEDEEVEATKKIGLESERVREIRDQEMTVGDGSLVPTDATRMSSSTTSPLDPPTSARTNTSATIAESVSTTMRTINIKDGTRFEVLRMDQT